jgi:DNA-binding MurR/RpiR family transcriptional regulator
MSDGIEDRTFLSYRGKIWNAISGQEENRRGVTMTSTTATSYDRLRAEIAAKRDTLSPRLRQLAEHALRHPDEMALETIAAIAQRVGVPPSSLIRFAHAFGFEGFSAMQRVFRAPLVARTTDYARRLQALRQAEAGAAPEAVLERLTAAGVQALEHLRASIDPERIERAAALLAGAETIHLVGQRRAFSVAAYLAYALGHLGVRARLLDGIGGMLMEQAGGMASRDVLLAVSFAPYAPETLAVARRAEACGVPIVALTDGPLSPLVSPARVAFEVEDAELEGFRALSATMCLALALVVRLGQRLGNGASEGRPAG